MFKKVITGAFAIFLLAQISLANAELSDHRTAQQCYSNSWNEQALIDLAKQNFVIENDAERNDLAIQLLNCLAIPTAKIRDDVAFTGLSNWLRSDKLSEATHRLLFKKLIHDFASDITDEAGVYQPFVALILSELARVDRKSPYLSVQQRELLVTKSTEYMGNISDYRGFENIVGWRHNVAHTADIFLQLALNPAIEKVQLTRLLDAIGQQVIPTRTHFYTYGEPERLSRALLYIFLRDQHELQDWQNWLQKHITQKPLTGWQHAYASQQGLSELHNARAFLSAILVSIIDSKNEQLMMLKPALINALENLP